MTLRQLHQRLGEIIAHCDSDASNAVECLVPAMPVAIVTPESEPMGVPLADDWPYRLTVLLDADGVNGAYAFALFAGKRDER